MEQDSEIFYTVDVALSRAFQRYITRPDIPTRSEDRGTASEVTKNASAVEV